LFLVVGLAVVEDPRCAPVVEPVVEPDVPDVEPDVPEVELDRSPPELPPDAVPLDVDPLC